MLLKTMMRMVMISHHNVDADDDIEHHDGDGDELFFPGMLKREIFGIRW